MKNLLQIFRLPALTMAAFACAVSALAQEKTVEQYLSEAPFRMSAPTLPTFPDKAYAITRYGAVGDGQTLCTKAIQAAIDTCAAQGGGRVVVPAGMWLTGPIDLSSNVNLHVEQAALLLFSGEHQLYADEGGRPRALISGTKLKNVAITGSGVIDGAGEAWRPLKKSKATEAQWKDFLKRGGVLSDEGDVWWPTEALKKKDSRPYMVMLKSCQNVLVEGVALRNSPNFMLYPNSCNEVTIRHISVFNEWWAQNGDGIDISASRNVVVYACEVSAGDDAICLKSSGDTPDKQPYVENVLVAACNVYRGHGGFVIGSNTNGGVANVFVTDCSFLGTDVGIRMKSNSGRGGAVTNVHIHNIYMADIADDAIHVDTYYLNVPAGVSRTDAARQASNEKIPNFGGVFLKNIRCRGAKRAAYLRGLPSQPVHDFSLEDISITAHEGFYADYAADFSFKNVTITTKSGENTYVLEHCSNVNPQQ
ncbi:MAG: glycoside hydrolase family 28 protein [Prevotellaceae bacterium]|jgi:DNA sulfur modification protein DndE|nr:glycoside hydrolase family 28 protein [Prevotellaceae bacterium]